MPQAGSDNNGKLWLFGGQGFDGTDWNYGTLNDLWEFDPSTNEWTWMGGSNQIEVCDGTYGDCGVSGAYGTLGTPGVGNSPGSRTGEAAWTDKSGNFWLYGGSGYDANHAEGGLNDLWTFSPSTHEWTWVAGSNTVPCSLDPSIGYNVCTTASPVYGTLGLPSAGNTPGGGAVGANWTDQHGNFWLFGGTASDASGQSVDLYDRGTINELWVFNPSTEEWAWMGGDYASSNCSVQILSPIPVIACDGSQPVYGTQNVAALANNPGARASEAAWTDKNGNLWLLGGTLTNLSDTSGEANDLWEYQPSPVTLPPAATPVFSLKSGTYVSGGPLVISNGMSNASIYYTLDGTTPTIASNLYSGAITVSSTETIKAIAIAPGYRNSNVASAQYVVEVTNPPASPIFSPASGTYSTVQTVTISDTTPGISIYYTVDGTAPLPSSPVYSGPIAVNSSETINALAAIVVNSGNLVWYGIALPGGGYVVSPTVSATYTLNLPPAAAPTFSPAAGTYTSPQTVNLSDTTPGAAIYYTTNGATPTTNSILYSGAITVFSSETLEAIATAPGYAPSPVASAAYTIKPPDFQVTVSPPTVTIVAGQSGTATFTITPQNGFNSTVSFSCGALPSEASCSFIPATVTPTGTAVSSVLTITTTAATASLRVPSKSPRGPIYALLFPGLTVMLGFTARRRRACRDIQFFALILLLTLASGLVACGGAGSGGGSSSGGSNGGGNPGTPVGTDVISVSASAGNGVNHIATLTITITH